MSVVINTNFAATLAANNLATSNQLLEKSLNRLSSGSKIVEPADDAGGMAVSMKLSSAARRQTAVKQNIGNAVSFLQTQDGVLKTLGKVLDRISELKVLFSDPTKNASDRENYDAEYRELRAQMSSLAEEKFNAKDLFGSSTLDLSTKEEYTSSSKISLGPIDLMAASVSFATGWSENPTGINMSNNALSYLNGRFFSGFGNTPEGGVVAISDDGINWQTTLSISGAGIYSFASGNGVVVASSNWGRVFYSNDNGNTWNESSYGSAPPLYVSFINGQFVGTLASSGTSVGARVSADGITWSTGGPNISGGIVSNGTTMVSPNRTINGGPLVSADGNIWTTPTTPPPTAPWYDVAYGNGVYTAVSSNGDIATSSDGNTWVTRSSPLSSASFSQVTFGGGKFIASGAGGAMLESTDGITWTAIASGTSMNLGAAAYGGGKFVITGENGSHLISSGSSEANAVSEIANAGSLADISLSTVTDAISEVATFRAQNGAQQARLAFADELVTTNQANLQAANSRIADVDVAAESTHLARFNILVQAGTAMLSQANQSSQLALKLLAA